MASIKEDISKKIQELQVLEQNLQHFLMEKQSIQAELNEISNAIEELKKSSGDSYRVIGGIMVKSSPSELIKDLDDKKNILVLRISAVEKQEKLVEDKANSIKKEVSESVSKNK